MNCIKPSGPYIAFLVLIFSISFVGIPKKGESKLSSPMGNVAKNELEEGRLEQIEKLSMLNIENHE
ncbi:MAG: hypothetical protein ACI8ZM_002532 [Crocinitomix sp.]|jgi:hypothetical protein